MCLTYSIPILKIGISNKFYLNRCNLSYLLEQVMMIFGIWYLIGHNFNIIIMCLTYSIPITSIYGINNMVSQSSMLLFCIYYLIKYKCSRVCHIEPILYSNHTGYNI